MLEATVQRYMEAEDWGSGRPFLVWFAGDYWLHFLLRFFFLSSASPSAAFFMIVKGPPLEARLTISCSILAVMAPVCCRFVFAAWTAAFFFGAMTRAV